MNQNLLPIAIILAISLIARSYTTTIAIVLLLLIKIIGIDKPTIPFIEKNGIQIGVTLLSMVILMPLINGKIQLYDMLQAFKSPLGLFAIFIGGLLAWVAGLGPSFMVSSPEIITSLLIGTIIGVCFFNGLAIGPLIAAGLVAIIARALKH